MRSFATIATFASIAFASIASALPAGPGSYVVPPEASPYLHHRATIGIAATSTNGQTDVSTTSRRDHAAGSALNPNLPRADLDCGIPDVLVELNDKITPLCHDLNDKVANAPSPKDALKDSLELLGKVKDLIDIAKGKIETLAANPVESVFKLKGKLLNSQGIAQILAVLIVTVTTILGLVVKAVKTLQTDELLKLIIEIAHLLKEILCIIVKIIPTILTDLAPLLDCVVDIMKTLKLTDLLQLLKIAV